MKTLLMYMALLVSLLMLAPACNPMDNLDEDPQVKAEAARYVDSLMQGLRDGTLESFRCPDVQWIHIPALLEYAKSTDLIGDDLSQLPARTLPANPLSSMMLSQCLEGTFALWMVEAARQHTLNATAKGYGGWPSLNPVIMAWNDSESMIFLASNPKSIEAQKEVYALYKSWWKASGGNKTAAAIDPLAGSLYQWH